MPKAQVRSTRRGPARKPLSPPKGYQFVGEGTTNSGDKVWNKDKRKWEACDSVNAYVEDYIAVARKDSGRWPIPEGYERVTTGRAQEGDRYWGEASKRWVDCDCTKGNRAETFDTLIRPIKARTSSNSKLGGELHLRTQAQLALNTLKGSGKKKDRIEAALRHLEYALKDERELRLMQWQSTSVQAL